MERRGSASRPFFFEKASRHGIQVQIHHRGDVWSSYPDMSWDETDTSKYLRGIKGEIHNGSIEPTSVSVRSNISFNKLLLYI